MERIDIGFSDAEVKAISSDYTVIDGPNDEGDMFWNTTTDQLKIYEGSSWVVPASTSAEMTVIANNASVAMAIALG